MAGPKVTKLKQRYLEQERREILERYTDHHRDMELADMAIEIIERMSGRYSRLRIVAALKAGQQRSLVGMDKAAEQLGAPYPAKKKVDA